MLLNGCDRLQGASICQTSEHVLKGHSAVCVRGYMDGGTISTCAFIYRVGQDPWLSNTHRQLLALYIYKSQCKCKEIIITLKLGDYNKKKTR